MIDWHLVWTGMMISVPAVVAMVVVLTIFFLKKGKHMAKSVFDQDRIYYSRDYGEVKTVVMNIHVEKLTEEQRAELEQIHERLLALAQKVTSTDKQTLKEDK